MPRPPLDAVRRSRLLPVLRCASAAVAVGRALRLADAGLEGGELTTTTPGWDVALAEVRAARPALTLGVGTVTTAAQASRAVEAGADFLVSPYPAPAAARVAVEAGVPMVTGGLTPAELAAAAAA